MKNALIHLQSHLSAEKVKRGAEREREFLRDAEVH